MKNKKPDSQPGVVINIYTGDHGARPPEGHGRFFAVLAVLALLCAFAMVYYAKTGDTALLDWVDGALDRLSEHASPEGKQAGPTPHTSH